MGSAYVIVGNSLFRNFSGRVTGAAQRALISALGENTYNRLCRVIQEIKENGYSTKKNFPEIINICGGRDAFDKVVFYLSAEMTDLIPLIRSEEVTAVWLTTLGWNEKTKKEQGIIRDILTDIFHLYGVDVFISETIDFNSKAGRQEMVESLKDLTRDFAKAYNTFSDKDMLPVYVTTTGQKVIWGLINMLSYLYDRVIPIYAVEGQEEVYSLPHLPMSIDIVELQGKISAIRAGHTNVLQEEWKIFEPIWDDILQIISGPYRYMPSTLYDMNIKPEYLSVLESSIPILANMWSADRIPETVEHSAGHSRRIVERFSYLMKSSDFISDWVPQDMKDEFVFIIVLAAYLHDIGHTIAEFMGKPVFMFPEIVRAYHHVFSVYMLEHYAEDMGVKKNEHIDEETWKRLIDSVYLVSLYHRKSMHLANAKDHGDSYFAGLFGQGIYEKYMPLMIEHERFKRLPENWQEMVLRASILFKMLDEIDVQIDRSVDAYFEQARNLMTGLEAQAIERYLKAAEKIEHRYEKVDVKKLLVQDQSLWYDHSLALFSAMLFKKEQKKHFDKHKAILGVVPSYSKGKLVVYIKVADEYLHEFVKVKNDILKQQKLIMNDIQTLKRSGNCLPSLYVNVVRL